MCGITPAVVGCGCALFTTPPNGLLLGACASAFNLCLMADYAPKDHYLCSSLHKNAFGPLVLESSRTTCLKSCIRMLSDRLCQNPLRPCLQDLCIRISTVSVAFWLKAYRLKQRGQSCHCRVCSRLGVGGSP